MPLHPTGPAHLLRRLGTDTPLSPLYPSPRLYFSPRTPHRLSLRLCQSLPLRLSQSINRSSLYTLSLFLLSVAPLRSLPLCPPLSSLCLAVSSLISVLFRLYPLCLFTPTCLSLVLSVFLSYHFPSRLFSVSSHSLWVVSLSLCLFSFVSLNLLVSVSITFSSLVFSSPPNPRPLCPSVSVSPSLDPSPCLPLFQSLGEDEVQGAGPTCKTLPDPVSGTPDSPPPP